MTISVVIPALNEEKAISGTVQEAKATLEAAGIKGYEVIVVNDGSSDRTGELARDAGAKVVDHLQKLGYGRSLKDGIKSAENEVIAIVDADGTYPIKELPRLYEEYRRGFHMVVGQRTGKAYKGSIIKSPLRALLRFIVELTAGKRIPDINSGLRVFQKEQALRYLDKLCDTFSFTTSLTLAFMMNGLYVSYLPIEYYERIGKTKVRLIGDSIRTLQYVGEAAVYYDPLRIFTAIGISIFILSVGLIILNFFLQSIGVFLLSVGGIILAVVIFCLGLIAALLKRILDSSGYA